MVLYGIDPSKKGSQNETKSVVIPALYISLKVGLFS